MAKKVKEVVESGEKTDRKRTLIERSSMYEVWGRNGDSEEWAPIPDFRSSTPMGIVELYKLACGRLGEDYNQKKIVKIATCVIPNGEEE